MLSVQYVITITTPPLTVHRFLPVRGESSVQSLGQVSGDGAEREDAGAPRPQPEEMEEDHGQRSFGVRAHR